MPEKENQKKEITAEVTTSITKEIHLSPKRRFHWSKFGVDAFLVFLSFMVAYYIRRGDLDLGSRFRDFLPIYFGCWLASSLLSGKFKSRWKTRSKKERFDLMTRVRPYFVSTMFFGGLLSVMLYGEKWHGLSRMVVFGALAFYLVFEIILLSGVFWGKFKRKEERAKREFSSLFFLMEFLMIIAIIGYFRFSIRNIYEVGDKNMVFLYGISFLWMFMGVMVHKFRIPEDTNFLRTAWPFVKSAFLIACVVSSLVFVFRLHELTRVVITLLAYYALLEGIIVIAYYIHNKPAVSDESHLQFLQNDISEIPEKQMIEEVVLKERTQSKEYNIPRNDFKSRFLREKLRKSYLRRYPRVFEFIDHVIDLGTIDILNAEVLDSMTPYNIEIMEDNSLEFLLNLHPFNDFGQIDHYLIDVNQKLKDNGFFVSRFNPAEYRLLYFQQKYPVFLRNFVYLVDSIWRQLFPKIPGLRKIHFTITRGKKRSIYLAEGLGRLYFCGFKIISLEEVDNSLFFIVQKSEDPYSWFRYYHTFNRMPSYGLIFKQKRVGKDMKYVYMYKLQTMHPYSEFLHQYVLDTKELDESGKIKDDFRITPWGKVFRKLWLDEIPMLINLLKGDIKLVGVRPLSQTFFNTYPEELQKERTRNKPGLIPPYYADLPKNMDEVMDSERRYLALYKNAPLKTDIIYLFKAFKNIVFRGAKSQ